MSTSRHKIEIYLAKATMLFLFFALSSPCFSQEQDNYKTVVAKFTSYYNAAAYDSIWQLCSPDMQKALPLEKTVGFFQRTGAYYGFIESNTYNKMKGTTAIYTTKFANGTLSLKIALDGENRISGLLLVPVEHQNLPTLTRNTTKLMLPFNGEWTVVWGGDTRELNHHVGNQAQKNAFDIYITNAEGKSYKTNGKANEDYYAFGQQITAPCDAVVVLSVDGIKDNVPGEENPIYVPGNSVILKTKNNEYLFFAHFKQYSVQVKEGDEVKQGQLLGMCGNSGNSTEPHLHFHMQNVENTNIATGAKCYFSKIMVDGSQKTDYSPVKGDKISNIH